MPEQEIDLSGVGETQTYSDRTHGIAMVAIGKGLVIHTPGTRTARCQSLSAPRIWEPAATVDDGGVVGVTCDCPNGKKGGIRARCWHAAALEHLLEEESARQRSNA